MRIDKFVSDVRMDRLNTAAAFISCFLLASCNSSTPSMYLVESDRAKAGEETVEVVPVSEDTPAPSPADLVPNEDPGSSGPDLGLDSQAPDPGPLEAAVGAATITDLVLITGQSNALGSQTTFDPVLDQPVERFYAYTDDEGWQPASLRQIWDLGWHPKKGLGEDPHNNFGFHFGKNVALLDPNRVVGIILASAPGEGISHWDTDNYFFNKIREKVLMAINDLPQKSGVDGILWHQGETDWSVNGSNDPELWESPYDEYYADKLRQLIDNFRTESWFDEGRPFICGETAQAPINDRLNELNRDSDSWTACVAGAGLPTYDGDVNVHFTAQSLRQLGSNYADVYLQMQSSR